MPSACSTCIYWDKSKSGPGVGICRFNAPAPPNLYAHAQNDGYWLVTAQDDGCGQYQSSPPPALMPAVSGVAPTQPAIAVTAEVMLGLGLVTGFSITPIRTGRIIAIMYGT